MTEYPAEPTEPSSEGPSELADQLAQALRLTFAEVDLAAPTLFSAHGDAPHWDQGTGHCDGLHPDLHGDMPHWDTPERAAAAAPAAQDRLATLLSDHRYLLEWTRQMAARLEERIGALEETVRQTRSQGGA